MNLNLTVATRYGLNILALLGLSVALYLGASILIPLVISALMATILFPAAKWLHAKVRLPWFFACLSTILLLLVLSGLVISAIGVSAANLVYSLPQDERAWEDQYNATVLKLRRDIPFLSEEMLPTTKTLLTPEELSKAVPEGQPVPPSEGTRPNPRGKNAFQAIQKAFSVESLTPYLLKMAGYGAEQLGHLVLILFVILFLLLEAELLGKKVRAIFGSSTENQQRVADALAEMAEAIRTYLVWRTIVNLGLAVVLGVFYRYAVNLEHWYLWAVLTAILSYVPYIGTIAAGVPPILDALIFNQSPGQAAVAIVVFYTVLVTVEGYLVVPWVMGRSMDLNATTVMLACLYWSLVWGVAGLFLAMPLMAAIKAVMLHVEGWQVWGDLLSSVDTTPAAPPDPGPPEKRPGGKSKADVDADATLLMTEPDIALPPEKKS